MLYLNYIPRILLERLVPQREFILYRGPISSLLISRDGHLVSELLSSDTDTLGNNTEDFLDYDIEYM